MKSKFWGFTVVILISLSIAGNSTAQEKKIESSKLPKAVLKSFHTNYPKAEIKGTSIESENGHKYYEIESIQGGKHVDLLLTKTGKIVEVEETISKDGLPAGSVKMLAKEFKNLKIKKAEKVTAGKKLTYELAVESEEANYELVLNSSGKLIKKEKISEGDEKGESNEKGESEEKDDND